MKSQGLCRATQEKNTDRIMASTEADLNALDLGITWSQLGSARESDVDAIIEAMRLDARTRIALVDIWKRHPRQQQAGKSIV